MNRVSAECTLDKTKIYHTFVKPRSAHHHQARVSSAAFPADVCHYRRPLSIKARPIQGLDLSKHHVPAIAQTFSTARCALACLAPNCAVLHLNVAQHHQPFTTPRRAFPKARVTGFALNGVSPPHSFLICAATITTGITRLSLRHSDNTYSDRVLLLRITVALVAIGRVPPPIPWGTNDVPHRYRQNPIFSSRKSQAILELDRKSVAPAYRTIFVIPELQIVHRVH